MITLRNWLLVICGSLFFIVCKAVAEPPKERELQILASVKPLGLLAEELLQGQEKAVVDVLLPPNASPHHFSLKVSDMARLRQVDLVLWVGPDMERFLVKALANSPAQQLMWSGQSGLYWPPEISGHEDGHKESHNHTNDPHLWLNPRNGVVMVSALVQQLQKIDPARAADYQARGQAMIERLLDLDRELQVQSRTYRHKVFVVYHRGYDHWVSHYRLNQMAAVTLSDDQRPSARHLYRLVKQLKGKKGCLFVAQNGGREKAQSLAIRWGLGLGQLDPLGVNADSYTNLLLAMEQGFSSCLLSQKE